MDITITETPGRCRWCGCTYERPCDLGCDWANRNQTLCTACVELDRLVRSAAGRKTLAELVTDAQLDIEAMRSAPPARRGKGR